MRVPIAAINARMNNAAYIATLVCVVGNRHGMLVIKLILSKLSDHSHVREMQVWNNEFAEEKRKSEPAKNVMPH